MQHWRSFEHVEAFASDPGDPHKPVWQKYWKRVGRDPRSAIWHETYLVRAGEYEAVYGNMPSHGLGAVAEMVPASEESTACTRLKRAAQSG